MAFADTAVRNVIAAANIVKVTLAEACEVGDLLAYNSGWVLADASDGTKVAKLVALDKGAIGDEIMAAAYAILEGPTGATAGGTIYLSDTAGGYGTSAGSVTQVVGIAITATQFQITPVPASSEISEVADGTIVNADVAAAAAIAYSKLAALTDGYLLVGSALNVATAVAMSGDVTITNAGVTAIGANKIDTAMITAANVTAAKLSTEGKLRTLRGPTWDIDTAAGGASTLDEVMLVPSTGIEITEIRIVYDKEQSGTVAAGAVRVGTAVNGEEIVASTALEGSKAVGYAKVCTLVEGTVAADATVIARFTGVAATQAGAVHLEIDYYCTDPA